MDRYREELRNVMYSQSKFACFKDQSVLISFFRITLCYLALVLLTHTASIIKAKMAKVLTDSNRNGHTHELHMNLNIANILEASRTLQQLGRHTGFYSDITGNIPDRFTHTSVSNNDIIFRKPQNLHACPTLKEIMLVQSSFSL